MTNKAARGGSQPPVLLWAMPKSPPYPWPDDFVLPEDITLGDIVHVAFVRFGLIVPKLLEAGGDFAPHSVRRVDAPAGTLYFGLRA